MVYYKKYSLIYWSILKNGTKVFRDLLNEIIGDRGTDIFQFNKVTEKNFIIPAQPNDKLITAINQFAVVRNPYDRLISQFYHSEFIEARYGWNSYELNRAMYQLKHFDMFKYWVKNTYEDNGKTYYKKYKIVFGKKNNKYVDTNNIIFHPIYLVVNDEVKGKIGILEVEKEAKAALEDLVTIGRI